MIIYTARSVVVFFVFFSSKKSLIVKMFSICLGIGGLRPSFNQSKGASSVEVELWGSEGEFLPITVRLSCVPAQCVFMGCGYSLGRLSGCETTSGVSEK